LTEAIEATSAAAGPAEAMEAMNAAIQPAILVAKGLEIKAISIRLAALVSND
jgi:hypothetical protein